MTTEEKEIYQTKFRDRGQPDGEHRVCTKECRRRLGDWRDLHQGKTEFCRSAAAQIRKRRTESCMRSETDATKEAMFCVS